MTFLQQKKQFTTIGTPVLGAPKMLNQFFLCYNYNIRRETQNSDASKRKSCQSSNNVIVVVCHHLSMKIILHKRKPPVTIVVVVPTKEYESQTALDLKGKESQ